MNKILERIAEEDLITFSYEESLKVDRLKLLQQYIEDKLKFLPNKDFIFAGGALSQIVSLGTLAEAADLDCFCIKPDDYSDLEIYDKFATKTTKEAIDLQEINKMTEKSDFWRVKVVSHKPTETDNSYNFFFKESYGDGNRQVSYIKPSLSLKKISSENSFKPTTVAHVLLGFDLINSMIAIDSNRNITCHKHLLSDEANRIKTSEYFIPLIQQILKNNKEFQQDCPYDLTVAKNLYRIDIIFRISKYIKKGFYLNFEDALHLIGAEKENDIVYRIFIMSRDKWSEEQIDCYRNIYLQTYGKFPSLMADEYISNKQITLK